MGEPPERATPGLPIDLEVDASEIIKRLALYSFLGSDPEGSTVVPVRICVFAPSSSLSGGPASKQELIACVRGLVEAKTQCRHDPDAQFHLELHLNARRRRVEDANEGDAQLSYEVTKYVLTRQPLHLVGTYYKRSRRISQTPMFVEASNTKARVGINSVEEVLFGSVRPVFFLPPPLEGKIVFASAGREDVDVQVLGRGRPFMLTLHDPRTNIPLGRPSLSGGAEQTMFNSIQERVVELSDGLVEVRGLRFATAEERTEVLEGAEQRRKVYACIIELEQPLEENMSVWRVHDLVIQQNTPVRVSHRRAMLIREKRVFQLSAIQINSNHLVAYVYSSAGLYIKEFVHGDLGRTRPTLPQALGLGGNNRARLVSLDVLGSAAEGEAASIDAFFSSSSFVW